ncbi:hypothetical protein J2T13_003112 [Paenibacillus sp. DS2015]
MKKVSKVLCSMAIVFLLVSGGVVTVGTGIGNVVIFNHGMNH